MKIILVGYMGCGKSSIGELLSTQLNIPFIDLDLYIAQQEQLTIAEIFKIKGELYFRKKETHYLAEILAFEHSFILATGGGTPCYGANMELMKKHATTIYLKTSIVTLVNRLISKKHQRPLIAHLSDDELPEFIGKHLFERAPFYQQSKFIITTDGKSISEVAKEIYAILC